MHLRITDLINNGSSVVKLLLKYLLPFKNVPRVPIVELAIEFFGVPLIILSVLFYRSQQDYSNRGVIINNSIRYQYTYLLKCLKAVHKKFSYYFTDGGVKIKIVYSCDLKIRI